MEEEFETEPSVYLDEALRVEIYSDYDLVSDFMHWQLDNKIWPFRGSSSGRGNSIDWFPIEYQGQIKRFFEDRNKTYKEGDAR